MSEDPAEAKKPATFSYAGNSPRQPGASQPDAKGEKLGHFWLARVGLLIFLVAVTASAVNVLSLAPQATVLPLSGSQDKSFLRPTATYEAAADKLLTGSIWNHTKVTLDTGNLSQQMLKQFPELTDVSITVPLLAHRPLFYIEPAQPSLLLATPQGSYVLDTSGRALLKVGASSQLPDGLPVLTDQSGLTVDLNRQALSSAYVKFIQIVVAELAAKQYKTSNLVLPAGSSELDAHLAGQPYFVKFNLQDTDPRGEAGTFLATIASLKKQNVTPSQYVDVRVPGRAYYK